MTIIRITEHTEGVEDYLVHGAKKGRSQHRNELDLRVPIYGSLSVLEATNCYVHKNKDWKHNYWHITISPAWLHHDMRPYELRQMIIRTLECYFHLYTRERLAAYAEIHYPKQQSAIDPETQEVKQRLPHVHLVISKLDLWSNNQLRILPYKKSVAEAFQIWLNHQHPASNCMQYNVVAQQALQIVRNYQTWHRQCNMIDLDITPYCPHMLLHSPTWQPYVQPDAESEKIFKRLNSKLPGQSEQSISTHSNFDALQGFRQWLNDVAVWYAEYQTQALLNQRVSMSTILSAAVDKFGLMRNHYQVVIHTNTHEEMAIDTRTNKTYIAVYFAYDILHMSMPETIKWLKQLDPAFDQALSEKAVIDGMKADEDDMQIRLS
ncbi:MAG TPA: hypothetical protein VIF37_03875 [Methylobacter sp.]|jgi:hypothetical protein